MENLKQGLLEHIANFLDDTNTVVDMNMLGLKDSEDLHEKMRDAAFEVFEKLTNPN